jgi:hypothetical protein
VVLHLQTLGHLLASWCSSAYLHDENTSTEVPDQTCQQEFKNKESGKSY